MGLHLEIDLKVACSVDQLRSMRLSSIDPFMRAAFVGGYFSVRSPEDTNTTSQMAVAL